MFLLIISYHKNIGGFHKKKYGEDDPRTTKINEEFFR
jgi:hypothetical protein